VRFGSDLESCAVVGLRKVNGDAGAHDRRYLPDTCIRLRCIRRLSMVIYHVRFFLEQAAIDAEKFRPIALKAWTE
jgi:hypothetical protein